MHHLTITFFLERKDQKNLEFYRPNISFDIFSNLTWQVDGWSFDNWTLILKKGEMIF